MFESRYTPNVYSHQLLIAVFWSDADNGGNVSFRETNNAFLRQQALEDVQRAYPAVSNIDYLFIATWYQVRPRYYDIDEVKEPALIS